MQPRLATPSTLPQNLMKDQWVCNENAPGYILTTVLAIALQLGELDLWDIKGTVGRKKNTINFVSPALWALFLCCITSLPDSTPPGSTIYPSGQGQPLHQAPLFFLYHIFFFSFQGQPQIKQKKVSRNSWPCVTYTCICTQSSCPIYIARYLQWSSHICLHAVTSHCTDPTEIVE